MAKRVNSPLKTTLLLLVVIGLGYAAYEYLYVRRILQVETTAYVPIEKLDEARNAIVENFGSDPCIVEVGEVYYRPKEDRYRAEVTVSDECHDKAAQLCREISDLLTDLVERDVDVYAFQPGSSLMARYLR